MRIAGIQRFLGAVAIAALVATIGLIGTPANAAADDCDWLVQACGQYCMTACNGNCDYIQVDCYSNLCTYSCNPSRPWCCPYWCWFDPWCECYQNPACEFGI